MLGFASEKYVSNQPLPFSVIFTCGEAAGPRKARVFVVVVVGPNQVVYLIANQSLTTNFLRGGIRSSSLFNQTLSP